MAIPKIFHQTYKTKELPEKFEEYRSKLLELHPDWELRFYDDKGCRDLIGTEFPSFLAVYDSCPLPVQKADIFRVISVYTHGGFYLDLDVECLQSLDALLEFRCVFAEELMISEKEAEKLGHRDRLRVANFMFGSEPGHPFLLHILRKMTEQSGREIKTEHDLLESTGPGLVTTVYHSVKENMHDLVLLRNIDRTCPKTGRVDCHFGNYAIHHQAGSWRWERSNKSQNELVRNHEVSEREKSEILNLIDSELENIPKEDEIYVLRTYGNQVDDGLSYVYERSSGIGIKIKDSRQLSGKKVLVSGVPHLFSKKLSPDNMNVVYTTFESDKLPGYWVDSINSSYSRCIVPHSHIKQMFESSGVDIPIYVCHQGFTRYNRRYRLEIPEGVFRIGILGVPYTRKNLFKLFQACVNLRGDIPELRLSVHAVRLFTDMMTPEISLVSMSPFVDWTQGSMSEDEIAKWYGSLSCYVFPSSGEGWSFTPRESMYLGVPTILSDIPVHRELIDSGFCRAIPVSGKEDADFSGHISGKWDSVNVGDIEEAIREVYSNYGSYYVKAAQGSRWIENRWTNEDSQQKLLDIMNNL